MIDLKLELIELLLGVFIYNNQAGIDKLANTFGNFEFNLKSFAIIDPLSSYKTKSLEDNKLDIFI